MAFDHWNSALIGELCKPMAQMSESHALINHANLTVLQLDPAWANKAQALKDMLQKQCALLLTQQCQSACADAIHPNAQAIAACGTHFMAPKLSDATRCQILAQRVALDPMAHHQMPLTLTIRLSNNHIAHAHYQQLLKSALGRDKGANGDIGAPANVASMGAFTPTPWLLPIDEAIAEINHTLAPKPKQQFTQLITQGRLRLTSQHAAGHFCVMCSAGAFIQLEMSHGLVDVLALSHELGHALDLEHRWRQGSYSPPEVVNSEAQAIAMEFYVLNNSLNHTQKPAAYAATLIHAQHHFYGPWHLALHRFELGLYGIPHFTPQALDSWWLECTQGFGADTGGWRHIQHFFTSPFYLICYPLALHTLALHMPLLP